jgi:hypothetical protein
MIPVPDGTAECPHFRAKHEELEGKTRATNIQSGSGLVSLVNRLGFAWPHDLELFCQSPPG